MAKKISLILLVLALFVSQAVMLGAVELDKKTVKKITKLMKKGNGAAKKGDFEKAFEIYNKALEVNKEYAPIYVGMANLYGVQDKLDETIAPLTKALELDPKTEKAAQMYFDTITKLVRKCNENDTDKANSYLEKIINLKDAAVHFKKEYLDAMFQLGYNNYAKHKAAKSNEYFNRLLEVADLPTVDNKKYINALYLVGLNFVNQQKFETAVPQLEKVLTIENLKTESLQIYTFSNYLLGLSYHNMKKPVASNKCLLEYIEVTKNNPKDQYRPQAYLYVGLNYYDLLKVKVDAIQKDKSIKDRKAKVAELAKADKNIVTYLEEAIKRNAPLEFAYMHMGIYYYWCNDSVNAVKYYKDLVAKYPKAQYKKFLVDLEKDAKGGKKKK
ncbi:MAG: tetratricopeptide repeat protein [bacterium]|nr:tetratricopeptide repeat protein [bacterium]